MTWQIDPTHSHIYFTARHMMIAKVRGRFERFDGVINFNEETPTATTIDIEIEAGSISTRDEQRDNHLRSADFFDVENHPLITFTGKRIEQIDAHRGRLIGDLTIRGIRRQVVLDVEYAGQATSPWGQVKAGFSAAATVNRKDWDLNWNQVLETGGWLVGDTVNIEIELELIKTPEHEAELALA